MAPTQQELLIASFVVWLWFRAGDFVDGGPRRHPYEMRYRNLDSPIDLLPLATGAVSYTLIANTPERKLWYAMAAAWAAHYATRKRKRSDSGLDSPD